MFPVNLTLETEKVLLRPVQRDDQPFFFKIASEDPSMWEYFSLNLGDEHQLVQWMNILERQCTANERRAFTIIDKVSGMIAGSSSLGSIAWNDRRVEIGWSWLGKSFRSTGINKHAKFAMMRYAFEEAGMERVEFKTDVLNERARKGLKGVGGIEEGILRSHMQMWNNRRRNSVFYSVLKEEWPVVKSTIFNGYV